MIKESDSFILRNFTESDYKEYCKWWGDDEPPAMEDLPSIGLVYDDMKAVGFLANTDCDFTICVWWMANPDNKGKESYRAMKELFKAFKVMSELMKKSKIFCYTNNRGIIRLLESLNFTNHDGHLIAEVST